jgi:RNA polymerase sigma factor (sigma-70 family)
MTERTDIQLMLQVRDGDMEAFAELAARWRAPLCRFFASLLPDPGPADDAAQEVLIRLWLLRDRYVPAGRFSAYLFQIARHHGLNQRKKFRLDMLPDSEASRVTAPPSLQPEAILLERLRHERVRREIARLPERCRTVFILCHDDGLRYAQIAERLSIPEGTVKSRMAEAVRRLRSALLVDERESTDDGMAEDPGTGAGVPARRAE